MSSVQRRLCAIMFSDIQGYSRMMGKDEEATLRMLEGMTVLMTPLIQEHRGTILKFIGDAVLAVFDSAVDAVECAVLIQRKLGEQNAGKPAPERMFIRIGIHIGDIVLKDGDVFGDGVNVAARIEPTARPGGICVSDAVYGMIRDMPGLRSESLGPHPLKNIREPVTIHRIITGTETGVHAPFITNLLKPAKKIAPILAGTALIFIGFWSWRKFEKRQNIGESTFTIAIAPFYATPDQAKDTARVQQDLIRQILNEGLGREHGVRILADGIVKAPRSYSAAKALGNRLNADAVIWGDVLILHDEISITPHLTLVKPISYAKETDPKPLHARLVREHLLDMQSAKANELVSAALLIAAAYFRKDNQTEEALSLLRRINPPTVDALYEEGHIYYGQRRWPEMERALGDAARLAPNDPRPVKLLGHSLYARGDHAGAARQFKTLLARNPRDADLLQSLGEAYAAQGEFAQAEKLLRRAIELDRKHALSYVDLGILYYKKRQFNRAADIFQALIQAQPNYLFGHLLHFVCLKKSGMDNEAADHLNLYLRRLPADKTASVWPEAIAFYLAGRSSEPQMLDLISQGETDSRVRRECEGYFYLAMARLFDAKDADRENAARAYLAKSLGTGLGNFYEYDLARFELGSLDEKRKTGARR